MVNITDFDKGIRIQRVLSEIEQYAKNRLKEYQINSELMGGDFSIYEYDESGEFSGRTFSVRW